MSRRREFPASVQRAALERSGRRCESVLVPSLAEIGCERPLRSGDFNYDHIIADALGGEPILENCAVLCKHCHAIKTGRYDRPAIASMKRARDRDVGIRSAWGRPLSGTFASGIKKTMSGQVIDRRTGKPLFQSRDR